MTQQSQTTVLKCQASDRYIFDMLIVLVKFYFSPTNQIMPYNKNFDMLF